LIMRRDAIVGEYGTGIAIVGMSCILPGGIDSHSALWTFLCDGRDAIGEVPPDRWNNDAVYDPDAGAPGKAITRRGGFISDIAGFDAGFFGISPREAAVIDPQQRMLLETAWRALEDAGVPMESLSGSKTGVYIGISHSDYHGIQKFGRLDIDLHTSTGGALSIAANRLSHRFDLRGPSLSVDTACSSSLVALDIACAALRSGECDMALVGGVNAILTPDVTITFSRASMLSPDGRCKAFDARANGYVRGEGAAMVVLKPLGRALADEDRIHAVIRATAVNQDGQTTTITVPSLKAQIEMLQEACRRAAIDPAQIGYVEAHGTGTPVGDPIEAAAIGQVFGRPSAGTGPCIMGSIKTNIGHLEPAAGVTGLVKAALCVKHGMIPPHLNFETPNPNIDFGKLGIEICRNLSVFPERALRRMAVVNSFGFGGTNACAVVQQPPSRTVKRSSGGSATWPMLLPLSAANRSALEGTAGDLADVIEKGTALADAAGTLALRRSHLDHRMVVIASDDTDAAEPLRAFAGKTAHDRVISGRRRADPRVAFVFTGQGAHWWAMGRGLLQHDPVFRQAVEECDEEFRALSGFSIIAELSARQDKSRLDQTIFAQPATFALQLGLAARWKAWGISPGAVAGHSIGEMAASYVCGALTLKDAVTVVHHRSRLQEQTRLQGGMAAVGLSAQAAASLLDDMRSSLEIAAVNAPELVTIAGSRDELQRLLAELSVSRREVFTRLLQVDYAFHSRQMDPFEEELRANLQGIVSRRPEIAMFSTVTGRPIEPEELSDVYWWRNMRNPVLFKDAVEAILDQGFNTFVEVGAHPALGPPLRSCLAHHGRDGTVVASLHREVRDQKAMATALAELHVSGVPVTWESVVASEWNFVELPGQRFEKTKYWAESEESRAVRFDGPVHPLLGNRLKTSRPTWQSYLSGEMPRYLGDHGVDGAVVFPAAGYVELILAASEQILGAVPWELEDIIFHDALVLAPHSIVLLQTSVDPVRGAIEVRSRFRGRDGGWDLRASARVRAWSGPDPELKPWQPMLAPPVHFESARFYQQLRSEGHEFGPAFQGVDTIWRENGQVLGMIKIPEAAGSHSDYLLHPSLLDSCFQIIRGFRDITNADAADATLALPIGISRLRYYRRPSATVFSRAVATNDKPAEIAADLTIVDDTGEIVATMSGFCCRRVVRSRETHARSGAALYQERWVELPKQEAEANAAPALAPIAEPGCWLVLSDRRGTGAGLARLLAQRGDAVISTFAGEKFRKLDERTFECSPEPDDLKTTIAAAAGPISHIVHLWSLEQPDGPATPEAIRGSQRFGVEAIIALTAAAADQDRRPRLSIVTAGSAALDGICSEVGALERASMLGAIRTIANEFPDMKPRVIDIEPGNLACEDLLRELTRDDDESEVAIRGGIRRATRLERVAEEAVPLRRQLWNRETRSPMFHVTMTAPGVIEDLAVRDMPSPSVGDNQVLIEVHAVGLNFRDVMAATGLLPREAEDEPAWQNLGFECAGVVRAAGSAVDPALIGARVVAVARGSFASHVSADAALVFAIPDELSFADAAALPTAYTTAQYALATIGRIRRGERVLIHAATGGVGLAAVSVARKHGAEIIATAGSEEKRAYLRRLGIANVFDSRSLSFADDVLAATDGYGVDAVLNSLPGPFLEKGLALLAPGGRFLEIGKRDIYADTLIGLRTLRRNAAFFAIDLARLAQDRPASLREELESVISDIAQGRLDKLPLVEFPMAQVADAFRHMARARHIGKVVVTCGDEPLLVETSNDSVPVIRSDAAYLVTGGLTGFGLTTARWLVEQGARHLVLVSRSGESRDGDQAILQEIRAAGAEVMTRAADLACFEDVRRIVDDAESLGQPLRGVFHAAGVIDDALVLQLGVDRIRRVFEPKVLGAWHLHEATRHLPLDLFVCFSSVAAHLGSIGQAHYAAANAALEAFAAMRREQGLPCLAVAWGAIGDVGYLARNPDVARHLQRTGVSAIAARDALAALAKLIARDCHRIIFADVNWPVLARANPAAALSPRTAALVRAQPDDNKHGQELRNRLVSLPQSARTPIVMRFVREQIAAVLKVGPDTVEIERPLVELGLDSLTSFELKNRIEAELGASLSIGAFLQRPTARDLAAVVLDKIDTAGLEASDTRTVAAAASDPVLSVGQEALWYVEQLAPGSPAYGLAMCINVRPHLDETLTDRAYQYVVARHECLRWTFPADASGPIAATTSQDRYHIRFVDCAAWSEAELRRELDRQANTSFDLATGPLIRVHLYRRADREILLLHVHHIVADATSVAIVVEQMLEAYFALRAGLPVRWSRPARSYSAYAVAQREMLKGSVGAGHLAYWRKELAEAPAPLALPTDFPRPASQRGPGASRNLLLPAALGNHLERIAQEQGTTLFTVLLCAFNVLLHRLTGDSDIVVGTPAGGRIRAELEDCVGYLVNALPLRTRIEHGQSFSDLLTKIDATVRGALSHQEFPFARMVRDLDVARDPTRSPIFQVMFAMERSAVIDSHGLAVTLLNTEGASISIRDFKIDVVAVKRDRAQFDLTVILEELEGQIYGVVDYRTDLWDASTIDRFVAHYQVILQELASSLEGLVQDLAPALAGRPALEGPVLSHYPDVADAVRARAKADPQRVAIEAVDECLTYGELIARIDGIAAGLRARGVGPQSAVGLCVTRTANLPVAMLAVLEAGAAYVPLDVTHPPARLAKVIADAEPALIIADESTAATIGPVTTCPVVPISELSASPPQKAARQPHGELAYIIHTSGSTGTPVGVEVRREALSSFLAAMAHELPITADDALLAVTTVSFDIAGLELLLPLTLGGRVVVADEATAQDGRRLASRLSKGDITAMQATPATWQMVLEAGWQGSRLFTALVGGERLQPNLGNQILKRAATLWNLYGPTETTIWSTCAQILSDARTIPIGRPIANTTCLVVDDNLKPVPAGVTGELLIGGTGLARGYRNNPERTAARFVPVVNGAGGKARFFRTGDFVRCGYDGALLFVGRRDEQVKVRGFRIELGEIEAVLSAHPGVREAAAVVQGTELSDVRIAAYVAAEPEATIEERDLRERLRSMLPGYMMPALIVMLPNLPRLANGKINRGRLASGRLIGAKRPSPPIAPRTTTEDKLLTIMREVLDQAAVGLDDDFFAVGGTSLLAMRYLARISDVFDVNFGPNQLMAAPSIAAMAALIERGGASAVEPLSSGDGKGSTLPSLWRPLAIARAEGCIPRVDAAAIAYLPDDIFRFAPLQAALSRRASAEGLAPHWAGLCKLSLGSIALIVAPLRGRDLFADGETGRQRINEAIAFAGRLGARTVSLTGIIPSATELGLALTPLNGVDLTTGHAATAASMGLTIGTAMTAAGRKLRRAQACFVGLGAIGTATFRMALQCLDHPAGLLLCDVPAKRGHLESLAQEAKQLHGFRGPIEIAEAVGQLPEIAYGADLFIGATNVENVIDVDRLKSGSVVVDDSFPLCFDLNSAMQRFEKSGDILFVNGGSVCLNEPIDWTCAMPPGIPALSRSLLSQAVLPSSDKLTGCILSSLLPRAGGLAPTLGAVTPDQCRDHWASFERLGITAATLHCGSWSPAAPDLARFRAIAAKLAKTTARGARAQ
jgi:amino acid adenylation domain-containing protein